MLPALDKGIVCVTIDVVIQVLQYLDARGRSAFADWFERLNAPAAAKVATALTKIEQANWGSAKGVGMGVFEHRINFGPGYRVYFGKDGDKLVILLAGGTKKGQQRDIDDAITRWQDYKHRKRQGER